VDVVLVKVRMEQFFEEFEEERGIFFFYLKAFEGEQLAGGEVEGQFALELVDFYVYFEVVEVYAGLFGTECVDFLYQLEGCVVGEILVDVNFF
jgi:hypothetical protein